MKIDLKYILIAVGVVAFFKIGLEIGITYRKSQDQYDKELSIKYEENKHLSLGFYENCLQDNVTKICCSMLKQSYWEFLNKKFVSDETKNLTDKACGLTIVKDIKQENGIIEGVKTGVGISLGNTATNFLTK